MAYRSRNQIWTIPNLISLFRLLLIPLMVGLYYKGKAVAALCVFALSAASDIADGQIARRFDMVTDLGKMLDPLADKLTQGAAIVCAARTHPQLFFLLGFMAMKELVQAAIGAHSIKRTGQVVSAMWYGKLCTVVTTGCLMALFAFPQLPEGWVNLMLTVCALVMVGALALYARRWYALNEAARREGRTLS